MGHQGYAVAARTDFGQSRLRHDVRARPCPHWLLGARRSTAWGVAGHVLLAGSFWISAITSSVISRAAVLAESASATRPTSIGLPNWIVTCPGPTLGQHLADRLHLLGADDADRDDRHAGRERQPGRAGPAPVEPPVRRAGALGVDRDQVAALSTGIAASNAVSAARPPARSTGIAPRPSISDLVEQPPQAGAGEVLRLGPERDVPGHHRAEEQLVGDRQVVAGEDRAAGRRDVLQALDVRPPAELDRRRRR